MVFLGVSLVKWDLKLISKTLNATIQIIHVELHDQYLLWFTDNNFKYYLHIQPENETIILAADPNNPMGMPFFEYSFNCNIIKIINSPYDTETKAVYFYENKDSEDDIRLAMNPRHDGNWYIWCNTWKRQ
jgi:hypothetical protein